MFYDEPADYPEDHNYPVRDDDDFGLDQDFDLGYGMMIGGDSDLMGEY